MTNERRAELRRALQDGQLASSNEVNELLDALEAAEKGSVAAMFRTLDATGAGEMYLTTSDENGKLLTAVIVAVRGNAEALMVYRDEQGREEELV